MDGVVEVDGIVQDGIVLIGERKREHNLALGSTPSRSSYTISTLPDEIKFGATEHNGIRNNARAASSRWQVTSNRMNEEKNLRTAFAPHATSQPTNTGSSSRSGHCQVRGGEYEVWSITSCPALSCPLLYSVLSPLDAHATTSSSLQVSRLAYYSPCLLSTSTVSRRPYLQILASHDFISHRDGG